MLLESLAGLLPVAPWQLAVIGLGVAVAYVIFGMAGFGTALVAGPVLAHFVPVATVVPLLALLDFFAAATNIARDRHAADRAELRRRHVAIVFQSFRLLEQMTALQNVAFAAQVAGERTRAAHDRAADLLDQLGLLNSAGDYPMTMSGGERQRLAIARALAGRPQILLADEPTGSLDSTGTSEIVDLLAQVHAEGQTILLVTHDDTVAAAAQRTVTLRDGRIDGRVDPVPAPA